MQRRKFLASSIAAAAGLSSASAQPGGTAATVASDTRLHYELRRYSLITGPQMPKLTESYLEDALIPGLNRLGITPVGAFRVDYGPETPAIYLLIPHASLDALVHAGSKLAQDDGYMKASAPFRTVSVERPAFHRVDSQLLHAFEGFPSIHLPAAGKGPRLFQLRTYESATPQAHERKVEMFNKGEYEIFYSAGFDPVFFGDALIGPRLPSLTYMLSFKDMPEMTAKWDSFRAAPAWKKLNTSERYGYEALVSNISNLLLSPTSYSQI